MILKESCYVIYGSFISFKGLKMRIDFDAKTLESLQIPAGKQRLTVTDARTRGLQFELRTGGGFFSYRYSFEGRQKGIPIGRYGVLKVADARKKALELGRMVALGQDPMELKRQHRQCPTFGEFFLTKYMPYVKVDKRSWDTDESLYRNHLSAAFGNLKMNQISKGKVREFLHGKIADGCAKGSVNRFLVLVRYCYNLALEWETEGVTDNPAKGIKPFQENNMVERFVTQDESLALKHELERSENRQLRFIIAFLLVTGARKNEALKARWGDIDLTFKVWRVPLSKSGKVRHITLSDTAIRFLEILRKHNQNLLGRAFDRCEFVFPNPKTLKPFVSIFYSWDTARCKAGLADVRIHDLRHTFASTLVNNGVSLYEVQKLLGHAHIRTTERYAHLKQERLQESASFAGRTFEHILNTTDPIIVPGGAKALQRPEQQSPALN
jgi:integrase